MKRLAVTAAAIVAFAGALLAQRGPAKPLDIYVVDTEGGKAALWVTPTGQSLLIEHDQSLRVGRAIMIDPREYGLWMIFLLRGGREGDHGLALATSTYTGLSIGVDSDQWHIAEDGVRECISARVIEVSLTRNPVFS